MQRLKESQSRSQAVYEKEIRRARKEAFKASSELVKVREEHKTTKNRFQLMREDIEVQKRKIENREKETFQAQYKLVGVEQELEEMKQKIKLVEEERDALRTSLKEEEVARIAAEGKIPLPGSDIVDEFSSPKKSRPHSESNASGKENVDPAEFENRPTLTEELSILKGELEVQKNYRKQAEDVVHLMKLECQLRQCICCRTQGYVHDDQFEVMVNRARAHMGASPIFPDNGQSKPKSVVQARSPVADPFQDSEPLIEFSPTTGTFRKVSAPVPIEAFELTPAPASPTPKSKKLAPPLVPIPFSESPSLLDLMDAESPSENCHIIPSLNSSHQKTDSVSSNISITMPLKGESVSLLDSGYQKTDSISSTTSITVPLKGEALPLLASAPKRSETVPALSSSASADAVPLLSAAPKTPRPLPAIPPFQPRTAPQATRIVSTTITTSVPLVDASASPTTKNFPYSPGATKTKQEALESIQRWRRGRARSVTAPGTPKRIPALPKRDISAPAGNAVWDEE